MYATEGGGGVEPLTDTRIGFLRPTLQSEAPCSMYTPTPGERNR